MGKRIVGVIAILVGGLWVLQGVGVAKGSFMTGHPVWSVIGAVLAVAGVALIAASIRGRRPGDQE